MFAKFEEALVSYTVKKSLISNSFSLFLEFVYRRTRVHPTLNDHHKIQRLAWCLENKKKVFSNFLFVDGTTIRIEELPLYHIRERGIPETHTKAIEKDV